MTILYAYPSHDINEGCINTLYARYHISQVDNLKTEETEKPLRIVLEKQR